ncbi:MAG TPA: type II toxin-antitoxin system VapC family toxin, partial [Promineifilum sp.]|nr:type II toxin-antitoxin system VapC family toxin [Promineifilum sp.]
MIVVDVNVIAYLLITGEKTTEARAVRELDADWIVPDLWRDEFLNILATYVRHGGIDLETAVALWLSAVTLFKGHESTADPIMALELAARHQLSAYDAQY